MPADRPEPPGADARGADAPARDDGTGADAVRAALNRARAAAWARGLSPTRPGAGGATGALQPGRSRTIRARIAGERRSGAGPDGRDPQRVGSSIDRLVVERGWQTPVAIGGVLGRWDRIVGTDVAAHCVAEAFDAGVLVVRTDSTAWATQVRLLAPTVLRRLAEELGDGVVERLVVRGPAAPSWYRGPRVAPGGRGPRDTYG